MTEPTNDIPVTTRIRDSYPLIVDKLNNYQGQIDEIELTPGPSAYEVAVNNGFSGTEAEWLASLEGDPGPKGDTGEGVPTGGAAGQVLAKNTATDYDTSWKDDAGLTQGQAEKLEALGTTCILTLSGDQTLSHNTWTPVLWNVETQDPGNWHDTTNPERITPPAGVYLVSFYQSFGANTTGVRRQRVFKAGSATQVEVNHVTPQTRVETANATRQYIRAIASGDYIYAEVIQDSGGSLAFGAASNISVTRIG